MNSNLPENWDLVLELFQNQPLLTSSKNHLFNPSRAQTHTSKRLLPHYLLGCTHLKQKFVEGQNKKADSVTPGKR